MSGFRQLIHEIHRRSLWQVLGIYVVGGWLVLQVVDTLAGALNLPDWAPRFALFLLIIGLPVVLATAFVQEGLRGHGDSTGGEPEKTSGGTPIPGTGAADVTAGKRLFTWRNAMMSGVGAFALLGVLSAGWMVTNRNIPLGSGDADGVIESIAVLPFSDMSSGGDQEYFSDGMAETLLDALAKVPGLRVSARTSSFQFKGENRDVREVAEKLNVEAVLEGSVRTDGNRVRVTAQLVDAEEGFHLWSETYDRQMTGIFELQDDIAHAIVEALRIRLPGGEETVLVIEPTENLDAFALFLRGRQEWHTRTREGLETALDHFQQAVELDSTYALAWAGLADTYVLLREWEYWSAEEAIPLAEQAAARAIDLDETLAEAHAANGALLHVRRQFAAAENEYRRAIELNPNYAPAHQWYGELLTDLGRFEEARPEIERAIELDPLASVVRAQLAQLLVEVLDFGGALEVARRITALDSLSAIGFVNQSYVLSLSGRGTDALPLARRAAALNPEAPLMLSAPMWTMFDMRDYEGAEAEAYVLIESGLTSSEPYWALSALRIEQGRYEDARAARRQALELDGIDSVETFLDVALEDAYIAARSGEPEKARAIMPEIEGLTDHPRWDANLGWIAGVYGYLGETDVAFDWLERAFELNSRSVKFLLVDPRYDALRDDPRFEEFTTRIKLPE